MKTMKKWKFFASLLKERDWLEDMARQGWILKDMTFGMLYHFEEIEPAEMVYEIDRFSIQGKPTKEKLLGRKTALDIAEQAGWKVITHDESMNYYFVKEKAGDESDEFYDDEELRKLRAEKFGKQYGQDMIFTQLKSSLIFTICFIFYFLVMTVLGKSFTGLAWIYILYMLMEIGYSVWMLNVSRMWFDELCLSREEWENRKCFGEKKKFKKTADLLSYLHKKADEGLMLTQYDRGTYLFAKTEGAYQYEIDTVQALKKRMKAQGEAFKNEEKDWIDRKLKWYEMSVAQAQKKGFELVTVIEGDTIVYRRALKEGEEGVYLNPGHNEAMGWTQRLLQVSGVLLVLIIIAFAVGFGFGSFMARIGL